MKKLKIILGCNKNYESSNKFWEFCYILITLFHKVGNQEFKIGVCDLCRRSDSGTSEDESLEVYIFILTVDQAYHQHPETNIKLYPFNKYSILYVKHTSVMWFKYTHTHTLILLSFALLCFTDTAFFYKSKVCGNPASSKSIHAIFPTTFAHFVSLCHILLILTIFQTSSLFVMVTCDQWSLMWLPWLPKGSDDG